MNDTDRLHPCWYMKSAIDALAHGRSGGPWMLYAKLHVKKCPQCRETLDALQNYIQEVKNAPQTPTDLPKSFWSSFESSLDEVETDVKAKKSG